MGSFNVACSISHLSIGPGEKCYFIPLIRNKYGSIDEQSNLISNEGPSYFFWPFCFPIEGEYNDYGGIENIVHNSNTKVIEEFVGITIEQLVSCLTGRRGFGDYFSEIHANFAKVKGDRFSRDISEAVMLEIGFERYYPVDEEYSWDIRTYKFPEHKFYISLKEDFTNKDFKFFDCIIYDLDKKQISSNRIHEFNEFMNCYKNATGIYLNYENQKLIRLLESLSGTFIKKEIYDYLASVQMNEYSTNETFESSFYINEHILTMLGFLFETEDPEIERYNRIYKLKGEDKYFVGSDGTWSHCYDENKKEVSVCAYHPDKFIEEWNKLSSVKIKIPDEFVGKLYGDILFDEISNSIRKNDEKSKSEYDYISYELREHTLQNSK